MYMHIVGMHLCVWSWILTRDKGDLQVFILRYITCSLSLQFVCACLHGYLMVHVFFVGACIWFYSIKLGSRCFINLLLTSENVDSFLFYADKYILQFYSRDTIYMDLFLFCIEAKQQKIVINVMSSNQKWRSIYHDQRFQNWDWLNY